MPTMMMIPDRMLFAKNSWLIPRRIALMTPSRLFAVAASAAERSVLQTLPCRDLGVGGRDEPADAAVGEVQRADRGRSA